MVKIFITNGCLGCRKSIKFFQDNNVDFVKKDFSKTKLTKQELLDILSLSNNGFSDILSIKSKEYQTKKNQINDLKLTEMINLIISNPMILSRPIVIQYDNNDKPFRLLVGYNASDIEIFLRKDHRKFFKQNKICGFENVCGQICGKCNANDK